MKLKVLIDFNGKRENKKFIAGEVIEVTKERAEEILKVTYQGKPLAEVVLDTKEKIETADVKTEQVEKAVKPKKKIKEE